MIAPATSARVEAMGSQHRSEKARPVDAGRIRTRFPRGATLNIVGPHHLADRDTRGSNNVESGTSTARGTYQDAFPERGHRFVSA